MITARLPSVSVCFPVYNEKTTVGDVLLEAHQILSNSGLDYEILVCDDGSTDGSIDIIEDIGRKFSKFRIIRNPHNLGIYTTFERLYSEAQKDFVFLNSTDKQWDTAIVLEMMPLTRKWDIIIASRRVKPYRWFRRFVSWTFNILPFILFGVRTFDAGAVKLVRWEIIERFQLISRSPFSEAERLIRAAKAGYHILNYPVDVSRRKTGRSRGVGLKILLGSFIDAFHLFFYMWREKIDK